MPMFNRTRTEVDNRQLDNVQADTGRTRAGWAAGRATRSVGAARPEVHTTSGATRTLRATPRR